jgi:internalin A
MRLLLLGAGVWLGLAAAGCETEHAQPTAKVETTPSVLPTTLPAAATFKAPEPKPAEEAPLPSFDCAEGPNVDFKDPLMEAEVRRKLQKPEGAIKKTELRGVKSLNLARGTDKLRFLDPCVLPHLTQLRDLFLGAGTITDLKPLAELKQLTALRASLNPIKDVSPLATLDKLDRLDLGQTQVEDVSPLAALTQLTELMLDSTPVVDVSPLAKLEKLEVLSLKGTQVKSISSLKPLTKLKSLNIADAPVDDPLALGRPGLKVIQE